MICKNRSGIGISRARILLEKGALTAWMVCALGCEMGYPVHFNTTTEADEIHAGDRHLHHDQYTEMYRDPKDSKAPGNSVRLLRNL